ncbi:ankyrin repeat-containing domain protein [Phaeosphaeria sp. MPI-PUGE-AT-0046c]|nr:ankyrin repeat-containing domain protein [Phaeosphaeria sp. MPI-PUGE-AT-0046c]
MPQVLPPYKIILPEHIPGMAITIMPMDHKHRLWLDDYEYYDQLGRDPLQVRMIWGIADAAARIEALKAALEEYPKMMHRRNILLKATQRGDVEMVRYLVESGVRVGPDLERAKRDEVRGMEEEEDVDEIELPDREDGSNAPVHLAAKCGFVEILKIFFDAGVDVDVRDEFGRTPLLAAVLGDGMTEAIKFLLERGADPTARISGNQLAKEYIGEFMEANALEIVAREGNVEALELLLKNPSVKITPLAIKAVAGSNKGFRALRMLLERSGCLALGEDEFIDIEENADLKEAAVESIAKGVEINDLDAMKLLLGFKYPELKTGNATADQVPEELHKFFVYGAYSAIKLEYVDKFEFIYNIGLTEHDTMSLDDLPEGQTLNIQHLFDTAAEHGSVNCARLLIDKYDASPHVCRMPSGVLPLYVAAGNNKADMVRFLLEEHHVDTHIGSGRFVAGPTALWIAISLKWLESIDILLQHGGPVDHIDQEILDIDGPIDAVLSNHRDNTVRFETEDNAKTFIDGARNRQQPNSPYVRIRLVTEDREWIEKLQIRKADAQLRKEGDRRELNKSEAVGPESRLFPEFVTYQDRQDELEEDDDLLPFFEPAFKAV